MLVTVTVRGNSERRDNVLVIPSAFISAVAKGTKLIQCELTFLRWESRKNAARNYAGAVSNILIFVWRLTLLSYLRQVPCLTHWTLITCLFMGINMLKTSLCSGYPQIHVYCSLKGIACSGSLWGWGKGCCSGRSKGLRQGRGISCRLIFQFLSWIVSDV